MLIFPSISGSFPKIVSKNFQNETIADFYGVHHLFSHYLGDCEVIVKSVKLNQMDSVQS
jgi:hypothetical protein